MEDNKIVNNNIIKNKTFNNKIVDNKIVYWTGLIYLIIMVLFVGLKICAYLGFFNWTGASYFYRILVQIGFMAVLPLLLFKLFTKKTFKQTFSTFSFRTISWKAILISLVLGVCLFILITYISSFWSGLLSLFGYQSSSGTTDYSVLNFILALVFVGILPGICEEIAHRGLVLGGIKKDGAVRAILLCGLLFGFMHFNIAQFGYAFVAGMLFCFVTLLTRSIFPAMIMHFTNNALSTVVSYSSNSEWLHSNLFDWISNFLFSGNIAMVIIINTLLILITCSLLGYLLLKLFVEGKKSHFKKFQKNLKKELASTNLTQDIDTNDNAQVMQIYQEINMLNIQQKMEQGTFTTQDLFNGMSTKKTTELLLSEDMSLPNKRNPRNYIFYYCAIFLGAVGTLFTFYLGIM